MKGLELPGYEPRTLHAMALGLAVNARGADHNRSGAYEADLSGELDRLAGGDLHVAAAIETEDRAAIMDSLILCKFLRGVFEDPFPDWAALLAPVTGWDVTGDELRAHRPPHRRGQAPLQPARGLDPQRGPPPGALPERAARARLGPPGHPHPGAPRLDDRRLLQRPRPRSRGRARARHGRPRSAWTYLCKLAEPR